MPGLGDGCNTKNMRHAAQKHAAHSSYQTTTVGRLKAKALQAGSVLKTEGGSRLEGHEI